MGNRRIRRGLAVVTIMLGVLNVTTVARGASEVSGDAVMVAVPITAIAIAYFSGDVEGEKQWLRNTVATEVVATASRVGFNYTSWGKRPNGNPYGFPSGHIAFAGSGASFLQERYGWKYGVPAWLATAYVAYVRVDNGSHRVRDVAAAGLLAYGVGKLFVTPENATHLAPVIGPDYLGLRWGRSW